jgi:gamma-glutamyl:cysteine ligase YbdK (ATP-grasp superfamily)
MTNLDAMCQQAFDRHQQLLTQAERRRLLSSGVQGQAITTPTRRWRVTVATWLRRTADRLEPVADRRQVAMLRAVAHREISVDQALRLLDAGNGHRSAIV